MARLLDEIIRWREASGDSVLVVADGHPTARVPEGALYGVEIRYARSNERDSADDEIVSEVRSNPQPEGVTVVTSDRRLRERVTELGAQVESAGRFLSRIADIESRQHDRAVLAQFGIDESALLGRGGEARVFALDAERVLRLPHPGVDAAALNDRRRFLEAIGAADVQVTIPEVLEHREVQERLVVVERRLPGRNAMEVLAEDSTDRAALIRHHLDVASRIERFPCPSDRFGELWGDQALTALTFRDWAIARLAVSLRRAGDAFADIDPNRLTDELVAVLPDPTRPVLVHLDAFLGNMLAESSRITALLDFGPMTIAGPSDLDALVAIAYLAPEITLTANAQDRAVASAWAAEAGLTEALGPAERWIAAYWTGAVDDQRLQQWTERILLLC